MNDINTQGINSILSKVDINATLSKIRSLSAKTFGSPAVNSAENVSPFHSLMAIAKDAVQSVNQSQQQANTVAHAYLSGDKDTSVSQMMISSVKSKIAFEGLLAVRNKLIDSYKEIMNMPI